MYVYRGRVNAGGQEKGVDRTSVWSWTWCAPLRLVYEAAIILSQDWGFGTAMRLAKEIALAGCGKRGSL